MAWSTARLADLAGTTVEAVRHYREVGLLEEPDRLADGGERYGVPHLARVLQLEARRVLDADLAASIDRLQQVRAGLPVGVPDLPEVDRTLLLVLGRALDGSWTDHLHPVPPSGPRTGSAAVFEQLPPEADEPTRQRVAEAVAAATREQLHDHELVGDAGGYASRRADVGGSSVLAALRELYHPAQVDVLQRACALTRSGLDVQDER